MKIILIPSITPMGGTYWICRAIYTPVSEVDHHIMAIKTLRKAKAEMEQWYEDGAGTSPQNRWYLREAVKTVAYEIHDGDNVIDIATDDGWALALLTYS